MQSGPRVTSSKIELGWIGMQERLLICLDGVARRLHPARLPAHLLTGIRGERAALFELRRRGYTIVATRWSSPKAPGDIDLVGWHHDAHCDQLCFIEVKTRTARDLTPAASAVDDTKRRTLRRLARLYLATFPEGERRSIRTRFDVVSVYQSGGQPEVEVISSAFPLQATAP